MRVGIVVGIVLRCGDVDVCLAASLAENILGTGEQVVDIFPTVLRLLFVFAAPCALDQLADLAALCIFSELSLWLPATATPTKFCTLASVAPRVFVSASILHRRCIKVMQWPPKLALHAYEACWINVWCGC